MLEVPFKQLNQTEDCIELNCIEFNSIMKILKILKIASEHL